MKVLKEFLIWLLRVNPTLSQTEIARRAHLSQSVINKILLDVGTREPEPDTYRLVAAAFPGQWRKFLERHPRAAWQLYERYASWAIVEAAPPVVAQQRRKAG